MASVTRVVLDTNVLVAAAYNPRSASRQVVEACLGGGLTPVVSGALRREYEFILYGRPRPAVPGTNPPAAGPCGGR
jgi:predicted nucleic acid-binding protein